MRRTLLLICALVAAGSALPGHAAAPKAQVIDPAGDALAGQAGMDVVKAVYATAGTGKGKKYVPNKLIVTLSTAGPVSTTPGFNFTLSAMTSTCGRVEFIYQPGTPFGNIANVNAWAMWGDCPSKTDPGNTIELVAASAEGNDIVWTFSLRNTPLKVGTVFRDFRVWVDPCDPAVCFPQHLELGLVDAATGSGTWKLA